jgi:glycosyltransferase involved in cell wall biosynthesis
MIAPEPFLEPRGTPFSVFHRVRALSRLGHQIDLVTYPIGNDVTLPNVNVLRAWRVFGIRNVKIGPSLAKIPLDLVVFVRALGHLLRQRYDVIHTHEEAGFFGALFCLVFRIPHLYDMHSDLAQQMTNFKFTRSKLLIDLMHRIERLIIKSAKAVIVICPELVDAVTAIDPDKPIMLIENTAVAAEEAETRNDEAKVQGAAQQLRCALSIDDRAGPVLLYTGTFEAYQGLELVVDSLPEVLSEFPKAVYVLVGGRPEQITTLRQRAEQLGVIHALRLPGQRPPEVMPAFMQLADILLSPRSQGTNTPLKIYSYLHSGKPIVATNIRSHTQVLTDEVAMLVEPTAAGLAQGTRTLLRDTALRARIAINANALAISRYNYETFLSRISQVYAKVQSQPTVA